MMDANVLEHTEANVLPNNITPHVCLQMLKGHQDVLGFACSGIY